MDFIKKTAASPGLLAAGGALLGLLALAMFGEPDWSCGATLAFLASLFFALLLLTIVHAPGGGRTFAVGALAPAAAALLVPLRATLFETNQLAESLESVARERYLVGAAWLLAALVGASCAGLQSLGSLERRAAASGRRRPQFGLRALFAAIAIVAVWAANYRVQAIRANAEQEAIYAISGEGANVVADRRGVYPSWCRYLLGPSFHNTAYGVELPADRINEKTMQRLEQISHLDCLTIADPAISDVQAFELAERFPSLREALANGIGPRTPVR